MVDAKAEARAFADALGKRAHMEQVVMHHHARTADKIVARIAELEAEVERLKRLSKGLHDEVQFMRKAAKENRDRCEALSRTGAVREGDWRVMSEEDRRYFPHPDGSKIEVQVNDTGYRQRFTKVMTVGSPQWRMHLRYIVRWRECALEPAAPEGGQRCDDALVSSISLLRVLGRDDEVVHVAIAELEFVRRALEAQGGKNG